MNLSGKVIIVTGAGGNLGCSMSALLASRNARLVLSDINETSADEVCDEVRKRGGQAIVQLADVTKENDLRRLMDVAVETFGGLDVLVNNAGIVGPEHNIGLLDLNEELWDKTLDINLKSVFLASRCALRHMIKRGGGSIINISSDASLAGNWSPNAYAASKSGVNILTQYIAAAFGKDNVRCNAIAPGVHLPKEWIDRAGEESLARLTEHCMLPRLGEPDDIAKAVAFLASDDSYYITAQIIKVDGGLLDHVPHLAEQRRNRKSFY
jgi:NAD(P)-dependent dehydrogenase (short-subunit alcohol dehydrogenase family)